MSANKSFSTETSERYSRALFEVLKEFNELEKAEINVRDFQLVLDNSLEFKNFGQKSADEVCQNLKTRFDLDLRK